MKKIGIMTDSHSGILTEEAEKLGIKVLPMPFYIDDELYLEGVDLSREEFYEKLRQGVNVSTSQPSPQEVMETWDDMLKEYETLIYIPISSGLSGSCMTAQGLAQDEEYEGKVFVVDNGHVSTPLHRSVLDAVEMAEAGYSAVEIKKILEETKEQMVIYVGLSTLEYLKKGGRISSAVAFAGELLSIKPVISVIDGEVKAIGKARGSKRGNNLLTELVDKSGGIDFEMPFSLAYSGGSDVLLKKYIEDSARLWVGHTENLPTLKIGATIGTHVGPGAVAVSFFSKT